MRIKLVQQLIRNQVLLKSFSTIEPVKMSVGESVGVPLKKVVTVLENFAPKELAEAWDNTGLLVEPYTPRNISKILLTNDLTEDVAIEANSNGCEMIISYHPPIFAPLMSVVQKSWKEKIVSLLLENRIALYSPHTSWDSVSGGVNDWLASAFKPFKCVPIIPGLNPNVGAGRMAILGSSKPLSEAVACVKELTGLPHVRLAVGRGQDMSSRVLSVALCAGSGGSVLKKAQADLFVTGEMLHHDVLNATQNGTSVILTNHSDSERGFLQVFSTKLREKLNKSVDVMVSKCDKDPLVTV